MLSVVGNSRTSEPVCERPLQIVLRDILLPDQRHVENSPRSRIAAGDQACQVGLPFHGDPTALAR